MSLRLVSVLLLLLLPACAPAAAPAAAPNQTKPSQARVANGMWGSRQAGMTVSDTGAVLVFLCSRGTIDEPLLLDAQGRFKVHGTYVQEHPGPQRDDEEVETHPAVYAGHVKGGEMVFELRLEDTKELIDTFTVLQGRPAQFEKCR